MGAEGPCTWFWLSRSNGTVPIISPVKIAQKSPCYTVLFLHFFREALIQARGRVLFVKGKISGPNRAGRVGEVVARKALNGGRGFREEREIKSALIVVLR
jgi:hypothetical protein